MYPYIHGLHENSEDAEEIFYVNLYHSEHILKLFNYLSPPKSEFDILFENYLSLISGDDRPNTKKTENTDELLVNGNDRPYVKKTGTFDPLIMGNSTVDNSEENIMRALMNGDSYGL